MSAFISKIMAFIMSIMYFLGSYGIGTNDPVTIHVTDADGNDVPNVIVYYTDDTHKGQEVIAYLPIGTTDESGCVTWENQLYGERMFRVYNEEHDGELMNAFNCKANVSRTKNEVIEIQLDYVIEAQAVA